MTRRTTATLLAAALALACADRSASPVPRTADPAECAPGLRCAEGEACAAGRCVTSCAAPLATCDVAGAKVCVDTRHDPAHCGGCGHGCRDGEVCGPEGCAAACAAPLATCSTVAGSYCTDLRHDPANCGGCGQACGVGEVCGPEGCAAACTATLTSCATAAGALCVDPRTDPANCGGCGQACAAGQACEAGQCVARCAAPRSACAAGVDARCVDLLADRDHCGGCGRGCGGAAACLHGQCTAPACGGPIGLPDLPVADAGARAVRVVAADFDGDGHLDLATAGYDAMVVSLVLGDGAGRFGPPRLLPVTQAPDRWYPVALAAADLDRDGRADLVLTAQRPHPDGGDGLLQVVLDPVGQARVSQAFPARGGAGMALADLDGDGLADLVLGAATGLEVRRGAGDGTFLEPVPYAQEAGRTSVVAADLDGDGDLDLASATWNVEGVAIRWNDGSGAFPEAGFLATSWPVVDLAAGDADGDGTADLAVHLYDGSNAVAFGPAPAGFTAGTPSNSWWWSSVLLADVDGDGRAELISGGYGEGQLETWRLDGAGIFVPGPVAPAGTGTEHLQAADLDGDGRAEILVALGYGGGTVIQRWEGGGFPGPAAAPFTKAPGFDADVLLVDLDGDGALDLVGAGGGEFDPLLVMVAWGRGDGTFEPSIDLPGVAYPYGLAAGDVDGDGRLDLAVAGAQPRTLGVIRGLGQRRFAPLAERALPEVPFFVALGDLDGDGRDEVVVRQAGDQLAIVRAGPDGLEAPVFLTTVNGPSDAVIVDLDGDGRRDLVVAGSGALSLHLATGPLTFAPPQRLDLPCEYLMPVAAGDLNGNRWPDLVTACPFGEVRAFLDPGRESGPPLRLATGAYTDVATGDVDGDGLDDVVFATYPDGIGLARNLGGRFARAERFPARGWVYAVAAGDLDRDGWADVVSNLGVYRTTCAP